MTQAVKSGQTAKLLDAIYKNVRMATESILNLLPKVSDEKLKSDLTVQLAVYEGFASRAAKHLGDIGVKPEDEGTMTKLSAKWGMMMDTMRDSTESHIVSMVIEGTTVGMNEMFRLIRDSENTDASESSLRLARDVCAFEERTVEEMKEHLR